MKIPRMDHLRDLNEELNDITKREEVEIHNIKETFNYEDEKYIMKILLPYHILNHLRVLVDFKIDRISDKKTEIAYNCNMTSHDIKYLINSMVCKKNPYLAEVISILERIIQTKLSAYERM